MIVDCPSCKKTFRGPEDIEGRPASCPACGARFIVEGTPEPPLIVSPSVAPSSQFRRQSRPRPNKALVPALIASACLVGLSLVAGVAWLGTESQSGPAVHRTRPAASQRYAEDAVAGMAVVVIVVLCGVAVLAVYAAPSVIAFSRGHQNKAAILALNLLTGWSFVGWVAALVWSLTEVRTRDNYHYHFPQQPPG